MNKKELLEEVKNKILKDMVCPLKDSATNLVFGKGNPDAEIMFIGEAPGKDEDLQGLPFVGRSGQELNKLLNLIGLSLEKVYIANILKYRPANNRDPTQEEIYRHTPYLIEQIKIIKPKIICTLGNYATKFVLAGFNIEKMNSIIGITNLHGKAKNIQIDEMSFKVIPLYHPAAMLYKPPLREVLKTDFKNIKGLLEQRTLF